MYVVVKAWLRWRGHVHIRSLNDDHHNCKYQVTEHCDLVMKLVSNTPSSANVCSLGKGVKLHRFRDVCYFLYYKGKVAGIYYQAKKVAQ